MNPMIKTLTLAAALLTTPALVACEDDDKPADELQEAADNLKDGDLDEAARELGETGEAIGDKLK